VRGEVKDAVEEGEQDAQQGERGYGVVAEVLGIAEDIAGAPPVIVEPAAEGQQRGEERRDIPKSRTQARSVAERTPGFACGEGQGRADGGFL
jgi:hypothetical protein